MLLDVSATVSRCYDSWGGGGGIKKVHRERLRPEVQTLSLSCTMFDRNGNPFIYLP